jgi:hypothetical protein
MLKIDFAISREIETAREALASGSNFGIRHAAQSLAAAFKRDVAEHGEDAVRRSPDFATADRLHTELEKAASQVTNRVSSGRR